MTIRDIYDCVCRRTGKEENEKTFLVFLAMTIDELEIRVPEEELWRNGHLPPPEKITDDEVWVNDLFHLCIVDNICYLFAGDEAYKEEFMSKCAAAETTARRRRVGRTILTMRKYGW